MILKRLQIFLKKNHSAESNIGDEKDVYHPAFILKKSLGFHVLRVHRI